MFLADFWGGVVPGVNAFAVGRPPAPALARMPSRPRRSSVGSSEVADGCKDKGAH
jgi:hypothetical protein